MSSIYKNTTCGTTNIPCQKVVTKRLAFACGLTIVKILLLVLVSQPMTRVRVSALESQTEKRAPHSHCNRMSFHDFHSSVLSPTKEIWGGRGRFFHSHWPGEQFRVENFFFFFFVQKIYIYRCYTASC
jgi:hypothetical protein